MVKTAEPTNDDGLDSDWHAVRSDSWSWQMISVHSDGDKMNDYLAGCSYHDMFAVTDGACAIDLDK